MLLLSNAAHKHGCVVVSSAFITIINTVILLLLATPVFP